MLDHIDVTIIDSKFLKGTEHPDVKNFSIFDNNEFSGESRVTSSIIPINVPGFSAKLMEGKIY